MCILLDYTAELILVTWKSDVNHCHH